MCGAFRTKRRRTGGSKTRAGSENGAVSRNGVVNKYSVLCKNDALDSNGVRQSAATPGQRRAKPNGPRAGHTLETCVHYFRSLPRNTNKTTDRMPAVLMRLVALAALALTAGLASAQLSLLPLPGGVPGFPVSPVKIDPVLSSVLQSAGFHQPIEALPTF